MPATVGGPDGLVLGLADDPDHQRIGPFAWDPGRGPLLALGLPGAGGGTLAATVVLEAARGWAAEPPLIHVIDGGPGELVTLAGLAPAGAVVTAQEHERQRRLIQRLGAELDRRRTDRRIRNPRRLLVVHGIGALRTQWEERGDPEPWARLVELAAGGAACGIHLCLTTEGTVPHQLLSLCEQRVLFRLGDPSEVTAHGIPARSVPPLPADRGVTLTGGAVTVVQVARPADGLAAAVATLAAHHPEGTPGAEWIGVLPRVLTHLDLIDHARERGGLPDRTDPTDRHDPYDRHDRHDRHARHDPPTATATATGHLSLAVGLADRHLQAAALHLPRGGHALVSGPPRSGRTTTLARLASEAVPATPVVWVVTPGSAPPPLPDGVRVVGADDTAGLARAVDRPGPLLVLVDDADRTDDHHAVLAGVVADRRPLRHVVASGRNDRLRSRFGHWTREVRADGTGLLLVPDLDLDGDLLGVRLPRRPVVDLVTGRGWLAGPDQGAGGFVQVALPPPSTTVVGGVDPVDR